MLEENDKRSYGDEISKEELDLYYKGTASLTHETQKKLLKRKQINSLRTEKGKIPDEAEREKVFLAVKTLGNYLDEHKKEIFIILAVISFVVIFFSLISSCSLMAGAGMSALGMSTYPSADSEMLKAEEVYKGWEDNLLDLCYSFEKKSKYDEYRYHLDNIYHDPYVLISFISAYYGREWTENEAENFMDIVFKSQYTLTKTVTKERRYRYVTRTYTEYVTDPVSGETEKRKVSYREKEYYDYFICDVTLNNNDLSFQPVIFLDHDALSRYAVYMATLGNRADLFPNSEYIDKYINKKEETYKVSEDAISDETFRKMMEEALKYLGYPYVFGGSDPSTSFDCSGYVSWVINHSGWNVGRLGATALCNICTPVSGAELSPGDLIFFKGTYKTINPNACSHVGIYVGDGMMLHCGDPIGFTKLDTEYWQSHFYTYGRLPDP